MTTAKPNAVVAISSYVARGAVGNRAIVFALETLGFPVWSVPTVLLPWHPGHGPAHRITPEGADFGAVLEDLAQSKFALEVRAILSGYMGSVGQVMATAKFISHMRRLNPDLYYVCDPVIGDHTGLYVGADIAQAIRDHLVPLANVITPNRFEFSWLIGEDFKTNEALVEAARKTSTAQTLITSAFAMLKDGTGNLYVDSDNAILAEHRLIEQVPNGTGDLTAALFCARILAGATIEQALQLSTQSVAEILHRTSKRGADELTLALDQDCLRKPQLPVQMRKIGGGISIRRRAKPVERT